MSEIHPDDLTNKFPHKNNCIHHSDEHGVRLKAITMADQDIEDANVFRCPECNVMAMLSDDEEFLIIDE